MTTILAVDTSHEGTSVALRLPDGRVLIEESDKPSSHSESLARIVSAVWGKSDGSRDEDLKLVIGGGPGSFTGLRIGFAFMKGMAISLKSPLLKISSFEGAAWKMESASPLRIIISDARREEVFFGAYLVQDGKLEVLAAPSIIPLNEVEPRTEGLRKRGGFASVIEEFRSKGVGQALLELAAAKGDTAKFSVQGSAEIEPDYVRAVAAKTIQERGSWVWGG